MYLLIGALLCFVGLTFNIMPLCLQECVYCEDTAVAPIDDDLPDMDMGEMGEELRQEGQNAQSQSEESQPQADSGS